MATSSRSGVTTKIWVLASAVILVIALYTAGWFYAASLLREKTLALLGGQDQRGIAIDCADAEYRGYPFRIGLFCSKVAVDDHANGVSATFGTLRSAAQVYNPTHIVWELDSPAEIRTGHGLTVSTAWQSLQSSLVTKLKGVERASMVIGNAQTSLVSSASGQSFDLRAEKSEIHFRQNGQDLDTALTLQNASVLQTGLPQLLPPLNAEIDATLAGRAGILDGTDDQGMALEGTEGQLRQLKADLGQGQVLILSGPFSFDDEGRLSGKLKLRIEEIAAWQESLGKAFPDLAPTIATAANMLQALGGGASASLDITIRRGKVLAGGLIPIGEIPPI